MKFKHNFPVINGSSGEIEIDFEPVSDSKDFSRVGAEVSFSWEDKEIIPEVIGLNIKEPNLITDPILSPNSHDDTFFIEFLLKESADIEIEIQFYKDGFIEAGHISLPRFEVLELIHNILNSNIEIGNEIEKVVSEKGIDYPEFKLIGDTSDLLYFDDYLNLIFTVSEVYPTLKRKMIDRPYNLFKMFILADSSNHNKIDNLLDLEQKIGKYSEIILEYDFQSREEPNHERIFKFTLNELEKKNNFSEIVSLIDEYNISQEYPHILKEYQFASALANSYMRQNTSLLESLVRGYVDSPSEDYQDIIDEARENDTNKEKAEAYKKSLGAAIDNTDADPLAENDVIFSVAKYLDSKAWDIVQQRKYSDIIYQLFGAASEAYTEIDSEENAQTMAVNHYLRRGLHQSHMGSFDDADTSFKLAIDVATNASGEWDQPLLYLVPAPIKYRTRAEIVHQRKSSPKYQNLIDLIETRLQVLEELEDRKGLEIEPHHSELNGLLFETKAEYRISLGQYELAKENLDEAISKYSSVDREWEKRLSIFTKTRVEALIQESNSNFSDAADYHGRVASSDIEKEEIKDFHFVQQRLCEIKTHILERGFEEARAKLDDLSNDIDEEILTDPSEVMKYEGESIRHLIKAIEDYYDNSITEVKKVIGTKTQKQKDDTVIRSQFASSYDSAIVVVLSAQRLRTSGVDPELLNTLVWIAIKESFIVGSGAQIVQRRGLEQVPVESRWQQNLALHVLKNLEQVSMDESSNTGEYSGIVMQLMATLEQHLEILSEYYGKKYWGGDWEREIIQEDEEEDDEYDLTLGNYQSFISSEAAEDVANRERIHEILNTTVSGSSSLISTRNDLDHGRRSEIREDEYEDIKELVLEILKISSNSVPTLGKVETQNDFGVYSVHLYWGFARKQMWVETEMEMETGKFYYFPPRSPKPVDEVEIWEVEENKIKECAGERALTNLE